MTVGTPNTYQENGSFVPSPLNHGSMPTDGLKGTADSNVKSISTLWSGLPAGGPFGTAADVVAAGAIAAITMGEDVAVEDEDAGSVVAGKANTETINQTVTDTQFGIIESTTAAQAAADQAAAVSTSNL